MSEKKHEHHVGCAFGSPDCPEYGEGLEREKEKLVDERWEKFVGLIWYGSAVLLLVIIGVLVILELIEKYTAWL